MPNNEPKIEVKSETITVPEGTTVIVNGETRVFSHDERITVNAGGITGEGKYLEDEEKGFPRKHREEALVGALEKIADKAVAALPTPEEAKAGRDKAEADAKEAADDELAAAARAEAKEAKANLPVTPEEAKAAAKAKGK